MPVPVTVVRSTPFVEDLSERSGVRIEDDDAPRLTTLSGSADFLVAHTS
ncbi:hypothetical protein AB0C98_09220 [Streptomyces sp. NPDC048558]